MIEDKLTHDERLRLECIAQSIVWLSRTPTGSVETVIDVAGRLEKYVRETSPAEP